MPTAVRIRLFRTCPGDGQLASLSDSHGRAKMLGKLPKSKPTEYRISPAMERLYDDWPAPDDRQNEFFTNFKYSRISGLGNTETISRRDASKVIKANNKYYVWYTRRETESGPVGIRHCTETLPAVDWDHADIYYATSEDGFDWQEQGVAVARTAKGEYGDRSATTPDILVFDGKYYLFFQSFSGSFTSEKGDCCDVSIASAESPDGPWIRIANPVIELGSADQWDSGSIHDPCPLVYRGKIWLFYKGQPMNRGIDWLVRAQGVAFAERPEGPYRKSEINPVLNSGHETCLFPYREGIAALLCLDGPEKNTVQYAADGIRFEMKSIVTCPPIGPGPYCPDAFLDNGDGKGISWGLCHVSKNRVDPSNERRLVEDGSFIIRFDCDLHRDLDRAYFKNPRDQVGRFDERTYFQEKMVLEPDMKEFIRRFRENQIR